MNMINSIKSSEEHDFNNIYFQFGSTSADLRMATDRTLPTVFAGLFCSRGVARVVPLFPTQSSRVPWVVPFLPLLSPGTASGSFLRPAASRLLMS
jgi:hypothetical protein